MLDAVLLEWEGVLADTSDARREALLRALADEGVPRDALDADPAGIDGVTVADLARIGGIATMEHRG